MPGVNRVLHARAPLHLSSVWRSSFAAWAVVGARLALYHAARAGCDSWARRRTGRYGWGTSRGGGGVGAGAHRRWFPEWGKIRSGRGGGGGVESGHRPPPFRHATGGGESEGGAARRRKGVEVERAETARARRCASRRWPAVVQFRATRRPPRGASPPARGRTRACRASLAVRLPHGVEPLVHDLRDGRGRGDACVERHATYVSFRADAGGRNVSRDRAGRGSSGRTRESATRRRGEEDAFSGGIRRGRTRGAAGASAFARGKALKITAPGWTLSGKSGVGAKPGERWHRAWWGRGAPSRRREHPR